MGAQCPYCGTSLPEQPNGAEGPNLQCPTCGQELSPADSREPPPTPPPPPQPSIGPGGQDEDVKSGGIAGTAEAEPNSASGPTAHTPAWEFDGGSWLEKLWKTIWQVLLHPVLTFSAPGRLLKKYPLSFGLMVGTAGSVVGVFWEALLSGLKAAAIAPLAMVLIAPIGIILGIFVGAGITHLLLMLVGAARGGFAATFRVTGYSYAAYIFQAVPFLGGAVMAVWMLVVQVGGLAAAHGTTKWRVAAAMLIFMAIALVIVILFFVMTGVGENLTEYGLEIGKAR